MCVYTPRWCLRVVPWSGYVWEWWWPGCLRLPADMCPSGRGRVLSPPGVDAIHVYVGRRLLRRPECACAGIYPRLRSTGDQARWRQTPAFGGVWRLFRAGDYKSGHSFCPLFNNYIPEVFWWVHISCERLGCKYYASRSYMDLYILGISPSGLV